jgi:hypothetical protein
MTTSAQVRHQLIQALTLDLVGPTPDILAHLEQDGRRQRQWRRRGRGCGAWRQCGRGAGGGKAGAMEGPGSGGGKAYPRAALARNSSIQIRCLSWLMSPATDGVASGTWKAVRKAREKASRWPGARAFRRSCSAAIAAGSRGVSGLHWVSTSPVAAHGHERSAIEAWSERRSRQIAGGKVSLVVGHQELMTTWP